MSQNRTSARTSGPDGGDAGRARIFGRRVMRPIRWIGTFLYWLVGKYTPPPWLRLLLKSPYLIPKGIWLGGRYWFAHNLYSFTIVAPLLVAILAVAVWHLVRPEPPRVGMEGYPPGPTAVEEGTEPDSFSIAFDASAARLDRVDKVLGEDIGIEPAIQGEWRWDGDRNLVFKPSTDWAVGQTYTVELGKGLFAHQVTPETYRYRFQSAPFQIRKLQGRFFEDPLDPKRKKVVGTLRFTHPVDAEDFRNRVQVTVEPAEKEGWFGGGGKPLGFEVRYNPHRTEAYIHTDPVIIQDEPTLVRLTVNTGARAARGGPPFDESLTDTVDIPGREAFFRVAATKLVLVPNERFEQEQVLVVETSAGVESGALGKALKAVLLPVDRPEMQGLPAEKNYRWEDESEIGAEVLALSEPVELAPLPLNQRYPTVHSFRFKAPERRYVYLTIDKSAEAPGGYTLTRDYAAISRVPVFPSEVRVVHRGAVLPLSGARTIDIAARNVPGLLFEVQRVRLDDINHLVSQTQGDFQNPLFVAWDFDENNISERMTEVRPLARVERGKVQHTAFDFSRFIRRKGEVREGLFFLTVHGYDPRRKRTLRVKDRRMVLVTDLGVVVKQATDGTQDLFVQSLAERQPVAGASVTVLGLNGRPLREGRTDDRGHLRIASLAGLRRESKPVAYLVTSGGDLSFLPYEGFERSLGFSRFDVGGEETPSSGRGLDAYLFSDRGLYRPGDTLHAGIIVKAPDWSPTLASVPLEAVLTDPRGLEVSRRRIVLPASGFDSFSYETDATSPTGTYTLQLYVVKDDKPGALLNATEMKVEEFVPDSMRISVALSNERVRGWLPPEGLVSTISLKTLFGQPAAGRRVTASLTLSPARVRFPEYRGFRFFDPARAEKRFTERLAAQVTNGEGEAAFTLPLDRFTSATYRATLYTEGFEAEGGRSVSASRRFLVSPLRHIIGFKPDGDLGYIRKGTGREVTLLAIDPEEKPVAVAGLRAELVEWRYVSVLTRQDDDTYKYESVRKEIPLGGKPLSLPAGELAYALPTGEAGDFEIRIIAADGTELNRIPFTVVGPGELARGLEKEAELQITLEKSDYAPGEEIEMQIRAPYKGAGLITIEREKVHAFRWFRADSSTTVQRIRVPRGLEGNAYVNVTFVRALDSSEIFMNPLSYGVEPFTLSRQARTHDIALKAPVLARPGEDFTVRYSSSRKGRIALMAVNEGILQLADYRTPNPLAHFFRKRALEVETRQILDQLLPDFKVVQALAAPGGDAELKAAREADMAAPFLARNLNPFRRKQLKPVAFWSGILPVDSTERAYSFRIPDHFNGTLRVMAVAVSPQTVGAAQQQSLVRGHFVISPNVPTFVSPGDTFEVGVNVFNNIEGSGDDAEVTLTAKASEHLEILGSPRATLRIGERRDRSAVFKVRANSRLGSARLAFTANWQDKQSTAAQETSIRPAQPYLVRVSSGHLVGGQGRLEVARRLYPNLRILEASASTVPLGLSQGLLAYLKAFPYQCTEQLVSQAFPALVLAHRPEFGFSPDMVEKSLDTVLRTLQARQTSEGAFGFWAAHTQVSDMQSVYALHFLTEAREKGRPIPPRLLRRGLRYLRGLGARVPRRLSQAREQAYGLYVLTRNGVVTTNMVDGLRKVLDGKDWEWERDTTGIYLAAAYALLKQDERASELIGKVELGDKVEDDYEVFHDGLSRDAQLLYLLSRHFPGRLKALGPEQLQALVGPVLENRYNTLSSAYTILALDAYATAAGTPADAGIAIRELMADGKGRPLDLGEGLFPKAPFSPEARSLEFSAKGGKPLFVQVTESGFDLEPPRDILREGLEVTREFRNLKGELVARAELGEKLTVELKVRAVDGRWHGNVALVDLLPGGFGVDPASIPTGRGQSIGVEEETIEEEGAVEGEGEQTGEESQEFSPENLQEAIAQLSERGGVNMQTLRVMRAGDRFILSVESEDGGSRDLVVGPSSGRGRTSRVRIPPRLPPAFPEYVDIREDRVVVFGAVGEAVQTFRYTIQATNHGAFVVPPPFAESMYDRRVRGRGLGGRMEVVEPAKMEPQSGKDS